MLDVIVTDDSIGVNNVRVRDSAGISDHRLVAAVLCMPIQCIHCQVDECSGRHPAKLRQARRRHVRSTAAILDTVHVASHRCQ